MTTFTNTPAPAEATAQRQRLPPWLKRPLGGGERYAATARAVREHRLHTICEDARCPNIGECWGRGTATFLILGDLCTRRCGFCSVKGGMPRGELDRGEAERLADAVAKMGLDYVVITSVDRDDLPDRGAGHFADCMVAIRRRAPAIEIELLTPDFRGRASAALEILLPHAPFVWGHNVETVPRLYKTARPGSIYRDSLALLRHAAERPGIITKSSIMLGLGERREEIVAVLDDLLEAGVRRLTIGQYLRPTKEQLDVVEYIHPDAFAEWGAVAREKGFNWVVSAPFARSSYHAEMPKTPAGATEIERIAEL
jgi:lipoic acid synthetase